MIYTHHNCARSTTVHDVEGRRQINHVMSVDTETGEVTRVHQPIRSNGRGEIDTYTERFRSIYPIFAGERVPQLFHCYGRLQD